jgi:hypothetical protein
MESKSIGTHEIEVLFGVQMFYMPMQHPVLIFNVVIVLSTSRPIAQFNASLPKLQPTFNVRMG